MQRLLQIIEIPELSESFELEDEYKINKNNLRNNTKSLKLFYSLTKNFKNKLENFADELDSLLDIRNGKQKRRSKVDYYTFFIQNIISLFTGQIRNLTNSLHKIYQTAKNVFKQSQASLQNTTKSFQDRSNHHEIILKDYCQTVFPETNTIMYKLHLTNDSEIVKKQDSVKQAAIIQEAKLYNLLLNDYIKSNEKIISKIEAQSKDQALAIKQLLTKALQILPNKFLQLKMEESEILQFIKTIEKSTDTSRSKSKKKKQKNKQTPK